MSTDKLSKSEQDFIWSSPDGLALLMTYEDLNYSHASAVGWDPDSIGSWPTRRWTELYEHGRSIMAEDLEIWSNELLRQFGFPVRVIRGDIS
jgi:hypothetical protein